MNASKFKFIRVYVSMGFKQAKCQICSNKAFRQIVYVLADQPDFIFELCLDHDELAFNDPVGTMKKINKGLTHA